MSPAFLDTVGLLALWDEDDQWHAVAAAAFAQLLKVRSRLLTTSYVLLECGNSAARRPYREQVLKLKEQLEGVGAVIHPTADDWTEAWNGYRSGFAGQAGIVDQISFVVMHRHGLLRAFTNDRHFRAAGFEALIQAVPDKRIRAPSGCGRRTRAPGLAQR